ncbi:nitrogen regulation protein NR(II) [Gammaproteobacteria bacterium]|nr:nitrogen regulation protein NR(II) [Gammaproteobacteria bacterium]MDA8899403.1 nitrogen regulation protein NR(II) [Gammaproteobacteria bacterium]MDB9984691.1 nitrogen regulation protein NR(II) [Gammaproteobacteria bacterium]
MADINTIKNTLLNQLASEIIVLDKDLNLVWMNDSATSNGWIFNNTKASLITDQLGDKTSIELTKLLIDCATSGASVTKRGFKLSTLSKKNRIVDLTVSWSGNDNVLIMELFCIDNLNKIIDSSKNFSTQKIAANLARTLAHEVKNPLSGIKGSAQILSSKLSDDFSKKFLKIIIDETERLNNIVTKILTPPKKPKLELFNIHSALEKVFALSQVDKDGSLILKRDYDPSIPEIYGDEDLFIQAILNIVKNAQQALLLTTNPVITIKSRVSYSQPINGNLHPTLCEVSIIDNGPGIPTDIQEQVFFPMVSSKEHGSGLGLSISQDIIRIHGGAITFKTKSGETAFSIQIPIKLNTEVQSA